jgi:hypothetical protein
MLRVFNEDTLLHVRSKAPKGSLDLLNQNIGSTSPDTQMREIRHVLIECFMWSGSLKQSGGHLIAHMDEGGNGFVPEGGRHARLMEHRNDAFFNRPVRPLSYTILLGPISDSVLLLDAMINVERLKLSRHVFPALVIVQGEAREVINEGHPVAIALVIDWAMHIAVNKLEGPGGSCGRRWEWVCMHLTSFAGFTY